MTLVTATPMQKLAKRERKVSKEPERSNVDDGLLDTASDVFKSEVTPPELEFPRVAREVVKCLREYRTAALMLRL